VGDGEKSVMDSEVFSAYDAAKKTYEILFEIVGTG
jgi:hypothetical protein